MVWVAELSAGAEAACACGVTGQHWDPSGWAAPTPEMVEERAHHHLSAWVQPGDRGALTPLLSKRAQVTGELLVQN